MQLSLLIVVTIVVRLLSSVNVSASQFDDDYYEEDSLIDSSEWDESFIHPQVTNKEHETRVNFKHESKFLYFHIFSYFCNTF